jgi:multidrug efflux system membrane fusion protein
MNRCAAMVLLALVSCAPKPPKEKSLTAVRVRAVQQAAAGNATRYSANIEPASRVDVAFKVGGYVTSIAHVKGIDGRERLVQEGDVVTAGQELAAVRVVEYEQRLAEAKAGLAEALAAREQAVLDYNRSAQLAASQTVAKAELDAARVRRDAATARVDGAKVRVQEAQTALDDTHLKAPMNAVIIKRIIEEGTLAGPGTVAFAIADVHTVKVVFGVSDTQLAALHLGEPEKVTTEAFRGREFEGKITRIAPVADVKSRLFEIEITIENGGGELKPGMVAALELNRDEAAAPVAVLPLNAVVRAPKQRDRFAVFVVEPKKKDELIGPAVAHLRLVELGDFLGNQIPIRSGLTDGDQVIVLGASLVSDGETVQVIP